MAVAFVEVGVIVPKRVAKVVEIPSVHIVHLGIFAGFKSQNLDSSREIHPLF